jgi:hypothetical protein
MGDPSTTCAAHCRSRPPLTLSERHFRRVQAGAFLEAAGRFGHSRPGVGRGHGENTTHTFVNTDLCTEKSSHGDFWPRNFVGSKTPGCPEAVRSERPPDDCDPRGGVGGRRSRAGCTRPGRHVSVLHDYHTEVSGSRPDQLDARSSRTQPIVPPVRQLPRVPIAAPFWESGSPPRHVRVAAHLRGEISLPSYQEAVPASAQDDAPDSCIRKAL